MGESARTMTAVMRGTLVPTTFEGEMISVHEHALNILVPGLLAGPDGALVSVVDRQGDMSALGVFVSRLPAGAVASERVLCERRGLPIAGCLIQALARAPAWEGRLAPGAVPARDRLVSIRKALRAHGRPGGFLGLAAGGDDNPFVGQARRLIADGCTHALVGLGPGFTPSGDDFLAGVLLAESWAGGAAGGGGVDREAMRAALGRTTPGGRTLLALALQGTYPAYLLRFVEHVRAASSLAQIEQAVLQAVAHGETSGTDALLGLLWRMGAIGGA